MTTRDYSNKKSPCVICGKPRWTTKGSLPQGRCGECRAASAKRKAERVKAAREKLCAWCHGGFYSEYGRIYCQESCRAEGFRAKHGKKHYPRTSATDRGYGGEHRRTRKALLEAFVCGDICPLCSEPMLDGDLLDLDHSDPMARLRGEPGDRLTHSSCNRREGGRRAFLKQVKALT